MLTLIAILQLLLLLGVFCIIVILYALYRMHNRKDEDGTYIWYRVGHKADVEFIKVSLQEIKDLLQADSTVLDELAEEEPDD